MPLILSGRLSSHVYYHDVEDLMRQLDEVDKEIVYQVAWMKAIIYKDPVKFIRAVAQHQIAKQCNGSNAGVYMYINININIYIYI